jgi:hypothetical protein
VASPDRCLQNILQKVLDDNSFALKYLLSNVSTVALIVWLDLRGVEG